MKSKGMKRGIWLYAARITGFSFIRATLDAMRIWQCLWQHIAYYVKTPLTSFKNSHRPRDLVWLGKKHRVSKHTHKHQGCNIDSPYRCSYKDACAANSDSSRCGESSINGGLMSKPSPWLLQWMQSHCEFPYLATQGAKHAVGLYIKLFNYCKPIYVTLSF